MISPAPAAIRYSRGSGAFGFHHGDRALAAPAYRGKQIVQFLGRREAARDSGKLDHHRFYRRIPYGMLQRRAQMMHGDEVTSPDAIQQ